ncbi:MAG TPA: STN domain-containing protein [Myxococcales bacterium]
MNAVALAAVLFTTLAAAAPEPAAAPVPPAPPIPPAAAVAPAPPAAPVAPAAPALPAEAAPGSERARVLKGEWPANEPRMSLDLERVRAREAIKKLAEAAHWGVSFKTRANGKVDATFNDVPADEALATILKDEGLVATRKGNVITVSEAAEDEDVADSEAPAAAADDPKTTVHLELGKAGDRTQVGGAVTVAEGETVQSAVAVGGSVTVDGTVLQDAVSVGGTVKLGPKAIVKHDVIAVGGSLDIDPNAKVGGSRVSMGLGGITATEKKGAKEDHVGVQLPGDSSDEPTGVKGFFIRFGKGVAQYALLFVLGLLLLTFVPERVKSIGREIRRAPAQSGAVGLVGLIALVPLTLLLIVTIIGIIAIPFLYFGVGVALLVGFTALALEIGARVPPRSSKRTQVAVLALGCLAFFLVSQVPVLGGVVLFFVVLVCFGAALRTKLGSTRIDANFVPEP